MKLSRRMFGQLAASVAFASAVVPGTAPAQSYPTRAITFNVPFAAGGPADAMARVMGERMRAVLGQPILIENVAGAGGSIGGGRVAHAAPGGYTGRGGHWGQHGGNGGV